MNLRLWLSDEVGDNAQQSQSYPSKSSWSEGKVADALDEKLTEKYVLFSCGKLGAVVVFAGDFTDRKNIEN